MNRQPYGRPPKWWAPKLSTTWVRLTRRPRRWRLRLHQRLEDIRAEGLERLKEAVDAGRGVLLVANHSAHYDSEALYTAADRVRVPLHFLTAWQAFAMCSRPTQWAMQKMGCFSIDRESTDRQAFKQAVDILKESPYPLMIFPEGDIYHTTDRLTPFREGAAAIALSAAKRAEREIVVIPCGIKFWYLDDPTPKLLALMDELEGRVFLRPQAEQPLKNRIYRLAEGLLALKELDYLDGTREGIVADRVVHLTDAVLSALEEKHQVIAKGGPSERVKVLRQVIIKKTEDETGGGAAESNGHPRRGPYDQDMEDLFFVMQLYSYPGDYLSGQPTIERIAETLDKFEEDVLRKDLPVVRGKRRVAIKVGEPIPVARGEGRRSAVQLTDLMEARVQALIEDLCANPPRESARFE